MSLLNPVSESKSLHIDRQNLATFSSNQEIDPVTQLALECFTDIQNARLGAWHYFKKYTISTLAFTASLAIPTAAAGYALWTHVPHTVETAAGVSAAALTLFAINQGTKRITDVSPVKTLITLTTGALFYGAMQIGSCCSRSYAIREEEANAFIATRFKAMKDSLNVTYEGMARILLADLDEAKETPDALFKLKQAVEKVAARFDRVRHRLGIFGLSPSEITEATNGFLEACRAVEEYKITLRTDPQYNIRLLLALPEEKFADGCIPESVLRALKEANALELTSGYRVRKFVHIASGALLPPVVALGALYLAEADYKLGALSVLVSALASHLINRSHSQFEQASKAMRQKKVEEAREELTLLYKTLAEHCTLPTSKKRKRLPVHLKEAKALKPKLAQIDAAISNLGFDSKKITEKLQNALASLR